MTSRFLRTCESAFTLFDPLIAKANTSTPVRNGGYAQEAHCNLCETGTFFQRWSFSLSNMKIYLTGFEIKNEVCRQ